MGQWSMTVIGTGAHHNDDYAQDADRMFKEFVQRLASAGHSIVHASSTFGSRQTEKHADPAKVVL